MAIPMRSDESRRYGTGNETGIRLVNIQPGAGRNGLRVQGTLDMSDLLSNNSPEGIWRNADARRSVFIGSDVYGISDSAIRAAPIAEPGTTLDTVFIP